ncbi:MAG: hypothetical protein K0R85_1325 [Devosia sp.]|nr:hypothetical protein [Devosia sp.]
MFRASSFAGIDLAALFNAAPNPYVVLDLGLTIVGANEAYLRVTGRSREEITGRLMFDAFPSDPQSPGGRMLRASLNKVLADGQPDHMALIPYDTSRPGQPPQLRYWSATHTPILGEDGRMAFILQHTTDVTELERLRQGDGAANQWQAGLLNRAAAVQAQNDVLAAQAGHIRRLFEQAPSFMAVLGGPEHVFELANASYLQLVGHRDLIGRRLADALPEVVEQGFLELLDTVRQTGEPYVGRGVPIWLQKSPGAPPTEAFLDFIYQPIRGVDGEVVGIFAQGHDITELKRVEKALERETQFLSLAQEAGGVGTFEWDLRTNIVTGSPAFLRLYGLDPNRPELPITEFAEVVHPEDRGLLVIAPSPSMDEGFRRTEYRVVTPAGVRWIARQAVVIRNGQGEPERVLGAAFDMTERKEAEAQLALIAQESAHRIKNMLAMVHAITTQTLRTAPSLPEARDAIGARLVALGQAQDLLTHGSVAAGIADVVAAATQLHSETFGRFRVEGPNLELTPKAVLALGLMLHELATNALKYGALSVPGGGVDITWSERREDPETGVAFVEWEWREWGGPTVQEPTQKGFGSRLIERGLASNLGRAEMIYAPTGLLCRARITVARVAVG